MGDRVARFEIGLDGDAGDLNEVLASIKNSFRSAVADIERTAGKVNLFSDLEIKVKASAEALFDATTKAKLLGAEFDRVKASGEKVSDILSLGMKAAKEDVEKATKAYNQNVDALSKLHNQLDRAGIDTSNVARAQLKLADAYKAAAAAAEQQAAKQLLGVKTLADVQPQITKLNAAYDTLRFSGTLSAKEIGIAQSALQLRIRETYGEVTKLSTGFGGLSSGLSSVLTGAAARFLGVAAVVGTVTQAVGASIEAAKEYRQGLAEIGTVTNLTQGELAQLGAGVRQLATDFGLDLQESMKAVFELIRSGVPADNALEVLAVSAKAAKASLTDIGTTAKVSALLMDAFGLQVGELSGAFDALVQGSKDGGQTLKEFAANAGPLLNVARDLKVPFTDVVAVLTVMTDASNDAAGSAATLTKILVKLGDPEVRGKLRDLGITSTNVLDIFKELGERGIPLQQFIDLGIASTKTAAGVAALTNNASKLGPELEKIRNSAGATQTAVDALYDSPKERAARFDAALHETGVEIGLLVGSSSRLAVAGTGILRFFLDLNDAVSKGTIAGTRFDNSIARWVAHLVGVVPAAEAASDATRGMARFTEQAGRSLAETAAAVADSSKKIEVANAKLGDSAKRLTAEVEALQAASSRDVGDINARADAEIAALDRSAQAAAATAAKTIAIETKAAADRLEVIQQSEKDILAAVDAAAVAREAVQRRAGVSEAKIAAETAKARIDALAPVLAQYQAHYNALVQLAQSYAAKINAIGQERDSFTDTIRKRNEAIAAQGQNALDQYAANLKEIDRLIEASAVAAANNDRARARQLTDEAIARSAQIKEVIDRDGAVVIGKYEALATATTKTKKAEDGYLASLNLQDDAAKAGFDAASKGIDEVKPKLEALQATYDTLKVNLEHGLILKVQDDEKSIAEAAAKIDELTKPRVIPLTFQGPTDASETPAQPGGFARGGPVPRRFAGGGSVFQLPTWSKVPGTGNRDTVPAALRAGSFVIRKGASEYYGDGLLGKLARGFARGGPVTPVRMSTGGTPGEQFKVLHELKVQAESQFQEILDRAAGLPHPSGPGSSFGGGQDVRDYVKRALELIVASQDEDFIKELMDRVLVYYQKFYPGIEDAKRWNVPLVLGAFSSGPDEATGTSKLFKTLAAGLTGKRFAGGGGVDTIPALLTPGEHVMQPPAVRMYGSGFMHALNNMQVPRGMLENVLNFRPPRPSLPRVARFATGGPVGGAAIAAGATAAAGGGATGGAGGSQVVVHLNLYTTQVNDREIDRLVGALNKRIRRST